MSEQTDIKLCLPLPLRRMAAIRAAWKPILLNWLLPGAGYWVLDKKKRAICVFTVSLVFLVMAWAQLSAGDVNDVRGGVFVPQLQPIRWLPTLAALATLGIGPVYGFFAQVFGGAGTEPIRTLTQEYGASYLMVAGLLNWLITFDLWDRTTHRWWWRLPRDEQEEISVRNAASEEA